MRIDSAVCIDDDECCAAVRLGDAREHTLAPLSDLGIQPFACASKASSFLRLIGRGLRSFAAATKASLCLRLIGRGLRPFAAATKASLCLRLIGLGLRSFSADTLASVRCLGSRSPPSRMHRGEHHLRLRGTARQRSPELLRTVIKL